MRYSGIQPQYFPRLHYFARIFNTDIFMIREDVQFVRKHKYPNGNNDKSYQADTVIKHPDGKYMLSVPIKHTGLLPIKETKVSYDQAWISKHLPTIRGTYGKAPHFHKLFEELETILRSRPVTLAQLNLLTIFWTILHILGEKKVSLDKLRLSYVNARLKRSKEIRLQEIRLASESKALRRKNPRSPNEKIITLIKEVGAKEDFCGGTAMSAYMEEGIFSKNDITVTIQDWKCQEYPQRFMNRVGFIPNLSIIDLLMNVSHTQARQILTS